MFSCMKSHVGILVTPAEVEVFWKLTMSIPGVQKVFFYSVRQHIYPLGVFSASIYFVSLSRVLSTSQTLCWPLAIPSLSQLSLVSSISTVHFVNLPPPPPPPPHPPAMGKFIQVFSLTKRLSVSDTDCLGNYCSRDIVTSENVTNNTQSSSSCTHIR